MECGLDGCGQTGGEEVSGEVGVHGEHLLCPAGGQLDALVEQPQVLDRAGLLGRVIKELTVSLPGKHLEGVQDET